MSLVYTIMPDFGNSPWAWAKDASDDTTYVGSNVGDGIAWTGQHPISKHLQDEFVAWAEEFESGSNSRGFCWVVFHQRGLELAKRLKAEFGDQAKVNYVKPMEDPEHEIDSTVEIVVDGSVVSVAPRKRKEEE